MAWFSEFRRNRRRSKGWSEAWNYKRAGKFSAAASVYERLAAEILPFNELIYAGDCHDAITLWLKAGDIDNALRIARNALQTISKSDWIMEMDEHVDDICNIVGEMYAAGFPTAADTFAAEINVELQKHNLPTRLEVKRGKFPSVCPQCGGALPFTNSDQSLTCPFCESVIHAE